MSDALGDRMKSYENVNRTYLPIRMPTILRIDGCHFHTYTKGFEKPWSYYIKSCMSVAAEALIHNIQGAKIAYIQSDEISVLLNDFERFETQSWFGKNINKMTSVSASIATAYFNKKMSDIGKSKPIPATFDARAFVLPEYDVANYFYWRQSDAIRNSISGFAQSIFSHKELQNKSCKQMKEMLENQGCIWEDLEAWKCRGWCVTSDGIDNNIPLFDQDRQYINKYLTRQE